MLRHDPDPLEPRATVVFDCICVLCSTWTRFLIRRDRRRVLRFASMRSASGRRLLVDNGVDPDDPATFLLVFGEGSQARAHVASDAIIVTLTLLGGAWRLAAMARVIPAALRDALYRLIARNRYSWCGRRAGCYVPEAGEQGRFLA